MATIESLRQTMDEMQRRRVVPVAQEEQSAELGQLVAAIGAMASRLDAMIVYRESERGSDDGADREPYDDSELLTAVASINDTLATLATAIGGLSIPQPTVSVEAPAVTVNAPQPIRVASIVRDEAGFMTRVLFDTEYTEPEPEEAALIE